MQELYTTINAVERQAAVHRRGAQIFANLEESQPSAFQLKYWSGKVLRWCLVNPELKVNLLRLIDVLPALSSSAAIASHVNEYLGDAAREIAQGENTLKGLAGLLDWGINVNPNSLRAKVTALIVRRSVEQMAADFIAGRDPEQAVRALRRMRGNGLAFTLDLLGEYSVSEKEAQAYMDRYCHALTVLADEFRDDGREPIIADHPGEFTPVCVSVKLSALYSQASCAGFLRSVDVLSERLRTIVRKARDVGASLYIDAEDTGHNPLIYETFERVFGPGEFQDFPLPGIVVQAYLRDSEATIRRLISFAERRGSPIAVRLVKGAYWDAESCRSAQRGWPCPVFQRKSESDAQFERLSELLLRNRADVLPAFGSHNIRSLAFACETAALLGLKHTDFELQVLYGMAEPIAYALKSQGFLVRQYVPVGELIPGMGYLVRRLLENSSNESFLRHAFFDGGSVDEMLRSPTDYLGDALK